MSLLIKALANAEKDKQAELNKKQTAERVADAALLLELAPIEAKPPAALEQVAKENSIKKLVTEEYKSTLAKDAFAGNSLSLEEEAGLSTVSIAVSKYAKPKQGIDKSIDQAVDKTTAQSSGLKGNLQEAQKAAKPANKVAASAQQSHATQAAETNQKAAAKVFVANQPVNTPSSKSALVLLGVAGALMIWLGLQGYSYIRSLAAPDVVVVKPAMPIQPRVTVAESAVTAPAEQVVLPQDPPVAAANAVAEVTSSQAVLNAGNQTAISRRVALNNKLTKNANVDGEGIKAEANSYLEKKASLNTLVAENEAPKETRGKKSKNSGDESFTDSEATLENTSKHAPLKLVSKTPSVGVDPTLLSAYQAFNRGEDAAAQQQYRQVLQRDVRSVDALLGMAAIAQRQGRDADAVGWYQKVLDIEPRNTIALSAMVVAAINSPQANADVVGTESRIKSMLAQQPEAANLHAALGNLFATQNQWTSAQGAYFDASRFAPNNADYAFNLAISLDQLGKSNLALKQYQRALDLLNKSGASSPDRAALEARIQALQ